MASQRSSLSQAGPRESMLKRMFTIRLSFTGLIGTSIALIFGVGWVFAFGVIVGRGFNPEQKMPGLGRLAATQTESVPEDNSIIKAEDLTFLADLKTRPALSTEPESRTEQPTGHASSTTLTGPRGTLGTPATAPKPPQGQPATAQKNTSTQASNQAAAQAAGKNAAPAPQAVKQVRYNYVFQVIAYKRSEQADAFRAKLEGEGLRTRMSIEKGKNTVYRVQVLLRGTDADADATRAIIARQGVKNPTLASKTPLTR